MGQISNTKKNKIAIGAILIFLLLSLTPVIKRRAQIYEVRPIIHRHIIETGFVLMMPPTIPTWVDRLPILNQPFIFYVSSFELVERTENDGEKYQIEIFVRYRGTSRSHFSKYALTEIMLFEGVKHNDDWTIDLLTKSGAQNSTSGVP